MKILLILITTLLNLCSFAQRVVNNSQLTDIDEFDQADTLLAKLNLSTLDLYKNGNELASKGGGTHFWKKIYSSSGQLMEQVKGRDLDQNLIDFDVKYQKISDTSYESVAHISLDYAAKSSDFFVDSIIEDRKQRIALYRSENKGIYLRSVYIIDSARGIKRIERYDVDGKLVALYFPNYKPIAIVRTVDSTLVGSKKTITCHWVFNQMSREESVVYSVQNRIIEKNESWFTNPNGRKEYNRVIFGYDYNDRLVSKISYDQNGLIGNMETFVYVGDKLSKWFTDKGFIKEDHYEERWYDAYGNLTYYSRLSPETNGKITWKYTIDIKGLCQKRTIYLNDKVVESLIYKYK